MTEVYQDIELNISRMGAETLDEGVSIVKDSWAG